MKKAYTLAGFLFLAAFAFGQQNSGVNSSLKNIKKEPVKPVAVERVKAREAQQAERKAEAVENKAVSTERKRAQKKGSNK